MKKKNNPAPAEEMELKTVTRLLGAASLDTIYRDLYLHRARELLNNTLPYDDYLRARENRAAPAALRAKERSTSRIGSLEAGDAMSLAEALYDGAADIPLDPFSPDLKVLAGPSALPFSQLFRQAIEILSALESTDAQKKDFYARRLAYFRSQSSKASTKKESESKEPTSAEPVELGEDLVYSFSEATVASAARLGLTPVRTQSRRHFGYLLRHSWRPEFLEDESKDVTKERLWGVSYPAGTADRVKEAMEFFLTNPFINSCGGRYMPCLVIEDLLIEDFPEPEPQQETARSALMSALGLESRWGLSRIDIESALLQHGSRILEEELRLDPEAFRLVAIPPDIYTHLGPERGWGQKEMWTHFDGYRVLESGKLHALAGGDKRFGGTHDVVSFSPAYTSAKILARFAVVQRKRMMSLDG